MCGINGIISWSGTTPSEIERVKKSLLQMEYRGPDFSGQYNDSHCVLGHNRLAILDLDSRSNQPMKSDDERYSVVFNGEIYNFTEIKKALERQGVSFTTTSDTEVLLKGYLAHGEKIVEQLRGMFAFAIWDSRDKKMFAARDCFGEKPFYFFEQKNYHFGFASNLSGMAPLLETVLQIDKQAVYELLSLGYVSNESCIYKGIKKLSPGHFMTICQDSIEVKKYWSPDYRIKIDDPFEVSKDKIHELIKESVSEQLVADVSVGLFLSGGTDSSVIAAIASGYKKNLVAITMSVPDNKNSDEAEAAKFVAQKLKIEHRIVELDSNSVKSLPHILKTIEPLADASLIPSMAVAHKASKDFKVMLSGDGGDEIFGGYMRPVKFNNLNNCQNVVSRRIIDKVVKSPLNFPNKYLYSKLNDTRLFKYGGLEAFYAKNSHILPKELILGHKKFYNPLINYHQESKMHVYEEADSLLYVGIKANLANDFLFKMDASNMFYSVESRAPFLSKKIIDYTSQLRTSQLMPSGTDKEILKSIGAEYLPESFFKLPKKGFSIPYYDYLKTAWGDLLMKFANEKISESLDILSHKEILNLLSAYRKKPDFRTGKILYSILVFEIWLRVFHLNMDPHDIPLES